MYYCDVREVYNVVVVVFIYNEKKFVENYEFELIFCYLL